MTRLSRRTYLAGVAASLGGVLAAACDLADTPWPDAGPPLPRPDTGPPTPRPEPTSIRVLYGQWQGPLVSEFDMTHYTADKKVVAPQQELYRTTAFDTFQDRYPDSHVTLDSHHDPLPILQGAHAAGKAPDLFYMDDRRGRDVVRHGMAQRLEGRLRQWPDRADFVRPALEAGQYDRQQWGLPLFTQVYTLFYNRTLLRALGILRLPTTWDDLLTAATQSAKVAGHQVVRQGVNGHESQWFWWLLQSVGATLYRNGRAEFGVAAEEVLSFLRQLYRAGLPEGVEPPQARVLADGMEPYSYNRLLWRRGAVAHAWVPALPLVTYEERWRHRSKVLQRIDPERPPDATPPPGPTLSPEVVATVQARQKLAPAPDDFVVGMPPVPGKRYALPGSRKAAPLVHTHSAVLHLSAQSEHADPAWELLTLLLEPDTLYEYTNIREAIPPRKSIFGRGYLDNPKTQEIIDLWLRYGRPPFDPPLYSRVSYWTHHTFWETVIRQKDPRAAVDKLVEKLDEFAAKADPPYTGTTRA